MMKYFDNDDRLAQCMLGLTFEHSYGAFIGQCQRPFRPRGVAIWGAPPRAEVMFFVGTDLQNMVSFGMVPARFFAFADSFEHIARMVDEGKEPPAWGTWKAAEPGALIRICVVTHDKKPLGPEDGIEVAMWGHTLR